MRHQDICPLSGKSQIRVVENCRPVLQLLAVNDHLLGSGSACLPRRLQSIHQVVIGIDGGFGRGQPDGGFENATKPRDAVPRNLNDTTVEVSIRQRPLRESLPIFIPIHVVIAGDEPDVRVMEDGRENFVQGCRTLQVANENKSVRRMALYCSEDVLELSVRVTREPDHAAFLVTPLQLQTSVSFSQARDAFA
jgi:hypothetical protein